MPYDIQPREVVRVIADTGLAGDELRDGLRRVVPLVDEAIDAARSSAPVAAELDRYLADHDRTAREVVARIASALVHGELAVDAYVAGDALMAEQHARASVVFDRPLVPFPRPTAEQIRARPEKVRG